MIVKFTQEGIMLSRDFIPFYQKHTVIDVEQFTATLSYHGFRNRKNRATRIMMKVHCSTTLNNKIVPMTMKQFDALLREQHDVRTITGRWKFRKYGTAIRIVHIGNPIPDTDAAFTNGIMS